MRIKLSMKYILLLVTCTGLDNPLCPSVGWSVQLFFLFFDRTAPAQKVWCPHSSDMAPAHPHATGVAVYPALFFKQVTTHKDNL